MTEAEIIKKIQGLKDIKPNQDWALLCKNRILGEEQENREFGQDRVLTGFGFFQFISNFARTTNYRPMFKPVLVSVACFGILAGLFGFTQNTVPGDFFYSAHKIIEITQVTFSPQEQKSIMRLQFANERLEDLKKIAESNDVMKLAPTLKEFQANVSGAIEDLNATSSGPGIVELKGIAEQTRILKQNKQEVSALGVVISDEEIEQVESTVGNFIKEIIEVWEKEKEFLSEDAQRFLEQAREYYLARDYFSASQALESLIINH
jgi:hypothetical protein